MSRAVYIKRGPGNWIAVAVLAAALWTLWQALRFAYRRRATRACGFSCSASDGAVVQPSDGRVTERVPVPATDAYRIMVEEVSSVLRGGPGWTLPLAESRLTAAVLDAARASAAGCGDPVAVT